RFKDEILGVKLRGKDVAELLETTVGEALAWARAKPNPNAAPAAARPPASSWTKIIAALEPLVGVGLGYLPLGQPLPTLSGGEAQRLKLARALVEVGGARGVEGDGVLVVVDEPSAGLHARDVACVVDALQTLVDRGASVVVVEHDLDV